MDYFIKKIIILSFVTVISTSAVRGDNLSGQTDSLRQSYGFSSASGHKTKYCRYALLAAAGGLAFVFDRDTNTLFRKSWLHGSDADKFFDKVEWLGTENSYYFAVPAFAGYGLIFRNEKSLLTGAELAAGLVIEGSFTEGVKRIFGRKRPFKSDSPYDFFKGGDSFHSGHTATVFTLATVISSNYPKQDLSFAGFGEFPLVPVVMYSMASMVGVQRLYSDVHWCSDVYFGALAGYGAGRLMVYLGEKIDIHIFPLTTAGALGLAVGVKF